MLQKLACDVGVGFEKSVDAGVKDINANLPRRDFVGTSHLVQPGEKSIPFSRRYLILRDGGNNPRNGVSDDGPGDRECSSMRCSNLGRSRR